MALWGKTVDTEARPKSLPMILTRHIPESL